MTKRPFYTEVLFLTLLSFFCFLISSLRFGITGSQAFLFLNWNLFLAFLPWLLSSLLVKAHSKKFKFILLLVVIMWLLFFPNSLYILTDLFHLKRQLSMPVWFDTILILSFAWTGLLFGFLSLRNIEVIISNNFGKRWVIPISVFLIFLGSFGVYLGRYLRWNSWDIISEPMGIIYDIGERIVNPLSHPRTWGMTIFMGVFLNMVYWSLRLINNKGIKNNLADRQL